MTFRFLLTLFLVGSVAHCNYANDFIQFVATAFKKKQQVGAVAPFSRYTASTMIGEIQKYIDKQYLPGKKLQFLEVGAGNGALTKYFVNYLVAKGYDFEFDAVELDSEFSRILCTKFSKYPQVVIHNEDICTFSTNKKYDIIVSTLPLNCKDFTPEIVKNIMHNLECLASPNSIFLSVEYIGMGPIGYYVFWDSIKKEDYTLKHLVLDEFRGKHDTYTKKVLLNVPPTYVYISHVNKNNN